jgi:hypothetical protein
MAMPLNIAAMASDAADPQTLVGAAADEQLHRHKADGAGEADAGETGDHETHREARHLLVEAVVLAQRERAEARLQRAHREGEAGERQRRTKSTNTARR